MKIESIEIHNYKVHQNVIVNNIGPMAVFLGENGVGKSTLFDIFGFMKTCLTENIRSALQSRGGYTEVHSRDSSGDIQLVFKYRIKPSDPLTTYDLTISIDRNKNPVIKREKLSYRRGTGGQPWNFIDFANGKGQAITNESFETKDIREATREDFDLASPDILANVAQFLRDKHPKEFNAVLKKMRERIHGVKNVDAKTTEDGRILLRFSDGTFKDPFAARYVSDGTIKMFAYLIMLADPNPHMLLCVEEPENQLYPHLLEILAEEFREYSEKGGQVFISTHSPDLVNALEPNELFFINKAIDGYSRVESIAGDELIVNLYKEGKQLGYLWKQDLLDRE
jgi:predicted ATPase